MVEKIKAYFETLEGLSTKALTDSAEKLVRDEKQKVALLIAHIAEMSRRKAELACGYKNLFAYCVLCRYRHNTHYADFRIMPRSGGARLWNAQWARALRKRQRLLRGIIRASPRTRGACRKGGTDRALYSEV